MNPKALPKVYDPSGIEERWYAQWEKSNHFHVRASDPRPAFAIVIPPPNVTGLLHMGHALDNTLQDILIRYKRMDDFAALWVPGTDHAGIATQNVVERKLAKENLTRHQVGREKFVDEVWEWKKNSGTKIIQQLKRLGASCDWTRERFTMDPGLSKAVRKVFVTLYQEGLIYRSSYLISWCPRCETALSDLEVEHQEIDGELTYFNYETTEGEKITVATTRPETMLGDTAIAVNPQDRRYKKFIGKTIQHPFIKRTFPIIADSSVKKEFGTGAVKITPAHDPNDYELGKAFKLPFLTILDPKARIDLPGTEYHGMDHLAARKKIISNLKTRNLFVKTENHRHAVGHCHRCRTAVEPRISEQWFVKIEPLAKPAIQAVEKGKTCFVPENWTKTYLDWMYNIRDWCISRQLWWGHRIPVWYCDDCGEKTVALEDPQTCSFCTSKNLRQDPDVLDTWFSSALWPFSTLGWPKETPDLKKFYPTSVLVTGFDIIFFWVARMMMMGLKFMKDVPFHTVHIHALVRDEKGQKMSKSKGNVVDPLEIMDRYGTDAFRFTLTSLAAQGRDILLSEKRIEGYRNFMNKLWNASRFVLMTVGNEETDVTQANPKTMPDRWIRSRLNEVIGEVRRALEEMRFNEVAEALYQFTWHEFCDWYIELIKPHFAKGASTQDQSSSQKTMLFVLDKLLRLLHPIIPFVTEEIWQKLPIKKETPNILLAPYPKVDAFQSKEDIKVFSTLKKAVEAARNFRSENRIPPSKQMKTFLCETGKSTTLQTLKTHQTYLEILAGLELCFDQNIAPKNSKNFSSLPIGDPNLELQISWEGLIDMEAEKERIKKNLTKAKEDQSFLEKRLADHQYRKKAPSHLIKKDESKLADAKSRIQQYNQELAKLSS